MDHLMITYSKLFTLLVLLLGVSEGKLDIKCIKGRTQVVNISEYGFGNIYSPGYTERKPYPNQMFCQVNLLAQAGKYIRLTYNYIDIAVNEICQHDRIMVVNYITKDAYLIVGQYCGNIRVPDFISSSNRIAINFISSPFGTGEGFNITYREVSSLALCKDGEFQCRNRKCILDDNVKCNGNDDCGDGTDEENCGYPVQVPAQCGIPDIQPITERAIVDRVVGGREAARGSWPWQVDMQFGIVQPNGHFCGGSLLNSQWFITAAHCIAPVRAPFIARVHVGNHHKFKEDPYEQIRYVLDFFVYGVDKKQFLIDGIHTMTHDLALVKLNAPVKMNPHVKVVCLPQLNEELKTGERCFATGWGVTRGSKSNHALKQAEHPIQIEKPCYSEFQQFENETMICAGRLERLHGLCHGDSGGPLACKKDGKWHVYGVASYVTDVNFLENGGLCGLPNKPTVFNKISPKINWIKSVILNNS